MGTTPEHAQEIAQDAPPVYAVVIPAYDEEAELPATPIRAAESSAKEERAARVIESYPRDQFRHSTSSTNNSLLH